MTTPLPWRKSTFSSGSQSCVEMSRDDVGRIFVRNSNHPDAGTVTVTGSSLAALLVGVAGGELDDLVRSACT